MLLHCLFALLSALKRTKMEFLVSLVFHRVVLNQNCLLCYKLLCRNFYSNFQICLLSHNLFIPLELWNSVPSFFILEFPILFQVIYNLLKSHFFILFISHPYEASQNWYFLRFFLCRIFITFVRQVQSVVGLLQRLFLFNCHHWENQHFILAYFVLIPYIFTTQDLYN